MALSVEVGDVGMNRVEEDGVAVEHVVAVGFRHKGDGERAVRVGGRLALDHRGRGSIMPVVPTVEVLRGASYAVVYLCSAHGYAAVGRGHALHGVCLAEGWRMMLLGGVQRHHETRLPILLDAEGLGGLNPTLRVHPQRVFPCHTIGGQNEGGGSHAVVVGDEAVGGHLAAIGVAEHQLQATAGGHHTVESISGVGQDGGMHGVAGPVDGAVHLQLDAQLAVGGGLAMEIVVDLFKAVAVALNHNPVAPTGGLDVEMEASVGGRDGGGEQFLLATRGGHKAHILSPDGEAAAAVEQHIVAVAQLDKFHFGAAYLIDHATLLGEVLRRRHQQQVASGLEGRQGEIGLLAAVAVVARYGQVEAAYR